MCVISLRRFICISCLNSEVIRNLLCCTCDVFPPLECDSCLCVIIEILFMASYVHFLFFHVVCGLLSLIKFSTARTRLQCSEFNCSPLSSTPVIARRRRRDVDEHHSTAELHSNVSSISVDYAELTLQNQQLDEQVWTGKMIILTAYILVAYFVVLYGIICSSVVPWLYWWL
jgi:hypothetical protein